jgi:hypothetical protein
MSIYQFVRGPRLFIQAAREGTDPDAVNQNPDDEMLEYGRDFGGEGSDLQRVQTQRIFNTEAHSSASATNRVARKSGLKSVTRKIIRKTTTLTRGEQRTITESLVTLTGKDGKQVTTPQRYVSEKVVRTPWTDEDDMEDGGSGGAHSSGSSGKARVRSTTDNKSTYSNGHKSHSTKTSKSKVNDLLKIKIHIFETTFLCLS